MQNLIPAPVIAECANIISQRETHASMDNLFMYAGAPGEPPEGSKAAKALAWLRRLNIEEGVQPLQVLGRLIENYMEESSNEFGSTNGFQMPNEVPDKERIRRALERYELNYIKGGLISNNLGTPSQTLDDFIRAHDIPALDYEFKRALSNVDQNPREAVSAASNILESICKVYIEEQKLDKPAKQDLKAVWNLVRKDLGFDPSVIEDKDLQTILTGLFAIVEGIGALRTHTSSAHGAGKTKYKLEPRHARLAIHSAHSVTLFILESWKKKEKK